MSDVGLRAIGIPCDELEALAVVSITIATYIVHLIVIGTNGRTSQRRQADRHWPEADNRKDCFQEGFVYVIAAACATARHAQAGRREGRQHTGIYGNEETIKIISIAIH